MDYQCVPTTVFTPIEYGTCGYTEEAAVEKFGEDNIEVYHTEFKPLEWAYNKARPETSCYVKLICVKNKEKQIIGFHLMSPNAGDVAQGAAISIKLGITKK